MRLLQVIFVLLLAGGPAAAGVDIAQVNACADAARRDATSPAHCIDAAQGACMINAQQTPAVATLCFSEARDAWSAALSALIADVSSRTDESRAAIVRIETKYNLLANLMECDRVEELSRAVSDLGGDAIALQTAHCQASASAATYLHVYRRAGALRGGAAPRNP